MWDLSHAGELAIMWGHTVRKKHCSRRYWWRTTTSTIQHWFVHKYSISMQFCRSAPENLTYPSKPSGYQRRSIKHHQISIHCILYEISYSGLVNVLYIIPSYDSEKQDTGYLSFIPNFASDNCASNYLTYLGIIFFGKTGWTAWCLHHSPIPSTVTRGDFLSFQGHWDVRGP